VVHKFHDLDGDGLWGAGEPALEGVPFDFQEGGHTHHRVTDHEGLIRICFRGPTVVVVRELPRQTGGRWRLTTPFAAAQLLGCADVHLLIGNARIGIPATGAGAGARLATEVADAPRVQPPGDPALPR